MARTHKLRPSGPYFDGASSACRNKIRVVSLSSPGLRYIERSAFDSPPFDFEHIGMTSWAARLMRRAGRIAKRHGLTFEPFFRNGRTV